MAIMDVLGYCIKGIAMKSILKGIGLIWLVGLCIVTAVLVCVFLFNLLASYTSLGVAAAVLWAIGVTIIGGSLGHRGGL
jgi:hypothetical protein